MQYYREELDTIYNELKTSKSGLSQGEANLRLDKQGYNQLETKNDLNLIKLFFSQFK